MGVAMALSLRELVIFFVFLGFLGKNALDRRNVLSTLKSLAICVAVGAVHRFLAEWPWALRLAIDAALYAALAFAIGVVRPSDIKAVLKMIKDRKKTA